MNIKNLKWVVYLVAFSGILFTLSSLSSYTSVKITPYKYSSDSQWKNLKVLPQDISEDSLQTLMEDYSIALGVDCAHCHTVSKSGKSDYADDSKKEKEAARNMILMTRKINADYFNFNKSANPEQITVIKCIICHRAKPDPIEDMKSIGHFYQGN